MELQNKPPEYWKGVLNDKQFNILRGGGTEPKFSSTYIDTLTKGTFICVGCNEAGQDTPLFSSDTKYDSGDGWPSFYQPIPNAVETRIGNGDLEVICGNCEGHLGHVFGDGPPPTYDRYCINSVSLYSKRKFRGIEKSEPIPEEEANRRREVAFLEALDKMFRF